jgi:glycosyltransferase involved in cell wall biosynthesis
MSSIPFFSICIPCFNHAEYIGKTIRSVLEQDFEDFEIIVADNASTDNSRDIVRSFSDRRIRLIENKYNIGFAPNLQRVTETARGRFINVLSSDDLMNQGALRTYANVIAMHPEQQSQMVLMSDAWEIDHSGRVTRFITKKGKDLAPVFTDDLPLSYSDIKESHEELSGADVFATCMKGLTTAGVFCSVVYSRELWDRVEGYNSTRQISPDKHFMLKLLKLNPLVAYVRKPLYCYRRHSAGQAAQQARERVLKFQVDQYCYLMDFNDSWLAGTGVSRKEQRKLFITRDCLDHALVALSDKEWSYASKLLAFAWVTDPAVTVRQWKTLAVITLLAAGPIGMIVARSARRALRYQQDSDRSGSPAIV